MIEWTTIILVLLVLIAFEVMPSIQATRQWLAKVLGVKPNGTTINIPEGAVLILKEGSQIDTVNVVGGTVNMLTPGVDPTITRLIDDNHEVCHD